MQGLYGYICVGIQSLIDVAQQGGHGSFVRDQRQCVIIFLQLWKKFSRNIQPVYKRQNLGALKFFPEKRPDEQEGTFIRQTEKGIIALVVIDNKIDGVLYKWKRRLFLRIGFLHQDTVAQSEIQIRQF